MKRAVIVLALLWWSGAQAVELRIDAPKSLRPLLEENLDLSRALRDKLELSELEIDRLAAGTPDEARALLQTEGYFNPHITQKREGDVLTFSVDPGPRSHIGGVGLTFTGEIEGQPLTDVLRRSWGLPVGAPFSQSGWSGAKIDLLTRARDNGYARADWDETAAKVDTEVQDVQLSLKMKSGPLYHLGEVRVEGLGYQDAKTVQRLAGFAPGTPYTAQALLDFQERLQRTQLFDGSSVELLADDDNAAATPVLVRVREAPRQQATVGVGYHANSGQTLSLEYLNRRPFDLPVRLNSKLVYARDQRLGEVELSSHPQPDLSRNLVSAQIEEDRSGDEILTNTTLRLGRIKEFGPGGHDERFSYVETLRALQTTANGRDTSQAVSYNVQWTRRRLDSLTLPTQGNQGLLLVGAGRADSSSQQTGYFGRAQFKFQRYDRLPSSWYSTARVELDQVFASSKVGVPQKLLFRAGGDDSVRGYAYQDLGPQVNGLTVGGRVAAVASVEVAHPLSPSWPLVWGATFIDAGNAADRWGGFKPKVGAGVGLRVRSPIGPLKLDLARGFQAHQWRIHFTVGVVL
jgi:translocation and assembly module TamA